jgi:hypothetical protein
MAFKRPTERFCYLCDAVTPAQCICVKASQTEKASNLKSDGGYCPRCDTVWESPGKCRCETGEFKLHPVPPSEEYCDGWNDAIEAAAKLMAGSEYSQRIIRKLKK